MPKRISQHEETDAETDGDFEGMEQMTVQPAEARCIRHKMQGDAVTHIKWSAMWDENQNEYTCMSSLT